MAKRPNTRTLQMQDTINRLTRERDQLFASIAYVHKRLDEAGIPAHPGGPHSREGCRIGEGFRIRDRLDIALGGRRERPAWIIAAAKECADAVLVGGGIHTFTEIIERHAPK